jgi:hypothetical protein
MLDDHSHFKNHYQPTGLRLWQQGPYLGRVLATVADVAVEQKTVGRGRDTHLAVAVAVAPWSQWIWWIWWIWEG